jgi:hypothetical protein
MALGGYLIKLRKDILGIPWDNYSIAGSDIG